MMGPPQRSVTAPVGMQHIGSMSYKEKSLHDVEAPLETPISNVSDETAFKCVKNTFATWRPSRWNIRNNNKDQGNAAAQSNSSHFAYLDGLRGFAALLVYLLHHQGWAHASSVEEYGIFENAYGWDNKYYFICFPGVRIFFSGGHLAVAIFFVISGYVLAAGPLRAIHDQNTSKLADSIGSALFRRWIRLFLPVAATTFVWMTSWHLFGIRNNAQGTDGPERTYRDEIWKWYCDFKNFSFIFTAEAKSAYNDHAWTIPLEFRGSICIYTCLLAFRSVGHTKRLLCEAGLVFYFMYIIDGWFCCLFMIGMLLCDIDLLRLNGELPRAFGGTKAMPTWLPYVLMLACLYLGSVPSISNDINRLRQAPGWYLLSFLKPQAVFDFRWFYRTIAATLAMIAVPRIKFLRAFFESSFCQYLGKVSFALYLVQGPILWSIGDRIYAATGRTRVNHVTLIPKWINYSPFPSWGIFGLEVNYLAAQLILLPLTLWVADVVTRAIDGPSIKLAKWAFDFAKSEDWVQRPQEGSKGQLLSG